MSKIISMGPCPFCNKGHNTPCFAEFANGYHCYSCGKHKHVDEITYAFKDSARPTEGINYPKTTKNILHFSADVLQWLYSYFVFDDLIRKYKITYCKEKENSLVFNVIKNNQIVFWQQRYFPSKRFKTGGNKSELFFIKHNSSKLVLVEDYISAIRVGEFANVLCLWGVHLTLDMSKFIEKIDITNIEIWLDPDDAGNKASENIYKLLKKQLDKQNKYKAFAVREQRTLSIRQTSKQPKSYSNSELRALLET